MTLSAADYANLSQNAYRTPGVNYPMNKNNIVIVGGVKYEVLECASNPRTSYQGTIYQREDTKEIVVAHRGTEPKELQDFSTDGAMIFKRVNPQVKDAEALTQRALEISQQYARDKHKPAPQVTITGHSLGGALAQITAYKFHLHAETFNPYGAGSLKGEHNVPQNDETRRLIVNHAMAADPASAATIQPGEQRIYTTQNEVNNFMAAGYTNNPSPLTQRIVDTISPAGAAARPTVTTATSVGAHGISNFATVNEQDIPRQSALTDPQSQQRAAQYAPMITRYRDDVYTMRESMSVAGDAAIYAANTADRVVTHAKERVLHDELAAARAGERMVADARAGLSAAGDAMTRAGNAANRVITSAENTFLHEALAASKAMTQAQERVVAGVRVGLSATGDAMTRAENAASRAMTGAGKSLLHGALDASRAMTNALERVGLGPPGSGGHTRQPFDPRHPQHPDHALEQSVRQQLQKLNAAHDIKVTPEQLDNCTAAMLADARGARLSGVKSMAFCVHPDGSTNPSRVVMYEGPPHDLAYWAARTNMAQAVNTPAEQSYQRLEQNTQAAALQEQQMREQRQQWEQQSQGRGISR